MNAQVLNSVFASGFGMPARYLGNTSDFMGLAGKGADAVAAVPGPAAGAVATPLGGVGALGDSAGLGLSKPRRAAIGTTQLGDPRAAAQPAVNGAGRAPTAGRPFAAGCGSEHAAGAAGHDGRPG